MDRVHAELAALKRRLRLQSLAFFGVLAVCATAMGGADAVARTTVAILAESDAWTLSTKDATGTLIPRIVATQGEPLSRLKIQNANLELAQQPTGSLPSSPAEGALAYDSTVKRVLFYNGTAWTDSGPAPVFIEKPSDESVTNSTTKQDDDHLQFAVGANQKWSVDLYLVATAASGPPDLKYAINLPSGSSTRYWAINSRDPGMRITDQAAVDLATAPDTDIVLALDGSTNYGSLIHIEFSTGGTSGSFKFQWAQNSPYNGATTVKAGSTLVATRRS